MVWRRLVLLLSENCLRQDPDADSRLAEFEDVAWLGRHIVATRLDESGIRARTSDSASKPHKHVSCLDHSSRAHAARSQARALRYLVAFA